MKKEIKFKKTSDIVTWMEDNKDCKLFFSKDDNSSYMSNTDGNFYLFSDIGNKRGYAGIQVMDANYDFYINSDWREGLKNKPVLCWVWDKGDTQKHLDVVTRLADKSNKFRYITNNESWEEAEPLNLEEAKQFILECQ